MGVSSQALSSSCALSSLQVSPGPSSTIALRLVCCCIRLTIIFTELLNCLQIFEHANQPIL